MYSQAELDRIWDNISNGTYGDDPAIKKPTKIVDDESEQVLHIPHTDGFEASDYRRKPGGSWEIAPTVGKTREFE